MKNTSLEEVWARYLNKYGAIMDASREVRRVIDAIRDGRFELKEDPYRFVLRKLAAGDVPVVPVAEEKPVETE